MTSNTPSEVPSTSYMGRVKWFNNRAGYGFVTVMNNDKKDDDVFVHHSGINVSSEQYRYLVQGEYVSFNVTKSDSKDHKCQATNVAGIMDGKLMCETHLEMRKERDARTNEYHGNHKQDNDNHMRRPRPYGGGPRETNAQKSENNDGFRLAKKGRHRSEAGAEN